MPEMHYAQPIPQQFPQPALQQFAQPAHSIAPQQFAQPDPRMAQQFVQPAQTMAPPVLLEPPPWGHPEQMQQMASGQHLQQHVVPAKAAPPPQQPVPAMQQPQQLQVQPQQLQVQPQQSQEQPQQLQEQQRLETKFEESPLEDLPDVELMPKPLSKLEFTNDPVVFRAQRDAYDQSANEYMQHLHWEFENVRLMAVRRKDDIKSDMNARIDLQVSNHEEVLEMEFERQQGLLAQHVETKSNQLQRKVDNERAAQQEKAEERLKVLLEKLEVSRAEQLEAIRAAAAKESEKFNQAKALIGEYQRGVVSNEVDITSNVQPQADKFEKILRINMEELQNASTNDKLN